MVIIKEFQAILPLKKGINNSKQIVFIVSNLKNLSAKQHVLAYSKRWPIEKMFRTLKQSLGAKDCQSIKKEKQEAHLYATFFAFVELEIIKNDKKKRSPEEALQLLRFQNKVNRTHSLAELEGFAVY